MIREEDVFEMTMGKDTIGYKLEDDMISSALKTKLYTTRAVDKNWRKEVEKLQTILLSLLQDVFETVALFYNGQKIF